MKALLALATLLIAVSPACRSAGLAEPAVPSVADAGLANPADAGARCSVDSDCAAKVASCEPSCPASRCVERTWIRDCTGVVPRGIVCKLRPPPTCGCRDGSCVEVAPVPRP